LITDDILLLELTVTARRLVRHSEENFDAELENSWI
jgi:hypothetical protein